jgi:zona occludens toxin
VVERTFVMTKVKELGLSKVYVVQQYQRGYIKRAALINTWRKTYSPTIYNLYESYAVKVGEASGTESIVDKRQNILADKSLWFWGFVLLVLGAGSIFYLYHFFHRGSHAQADTKSPIEATAPAGQGAIKGAAVGGAAPGAAESRGGAWRLVGLYQTPSGLTAVLQGDGGRYRYVYDPPNVRQHSSDISVVLDGEPATPYTGGPSKSVIPGIAK